GYRTHPYVSTLMQARHTRKLGKHSPILGLLTFFPTRDGWKYTRDGSRNRLAHAEDCFNYAREQAEARGYRMEEMWTPLTEVSLQRAGDILYARGIEGVVLSPLPEAVTTLDWQWTRLAAVAVDTQIREPRLHRVRNESFQTMLTALEE